MKHNNGFSNTFLSATVLIVIALSSSCNAIKCYVCNSAFQPDCEDAPLPAKYLVTCAPLTAHAANFSGVMGKALLQDRLSIGLKGNFSVCRKQVFSVPKQTNGDITMDHVSRIVRTCGYLDVDDKAVCRRTDKFGNQNVFCQCNEESCNEASGMSSHAFLLFLPFFIFAGVLQST